MLPLFREPNQAGNLLRRFLDFKITDPNYLVSLSKYHDGTPLPAYDLAKKPTTTPSPDNKVLDKTADDSGKSLISYLYQPYDRLPANENDEPSSTGPETSNAAMPTDVGTLKITLISKQYADEDSTDEEIREFAKSYWGHRAFLWGEIKPIASKVSGLAAEWAEEADDDKRPGGVAHPADRVLRVSATIGRADTVDGKAGSEATAATCASPEGRVQLYVDGKPVGEPVPLRFADETLPDGTVLPANAAREGDDTAGHATRVSLSVAAADAGLDPASTTIGEHRVSLRFLPPDEGQRAAGAPANYLASEEPSEGSAAPWAPVVVEPDPAIAPEPKLAKRAENLTHPEGPTQPGDRIRYTITATNSEKGSLWTDVVATDALPACLVLDEGSVRLDNPSAGISGKKLDKAASAAAGDDLWGGQRVVLTFEVTVGEAALGAQNANIALAHGKVPSEDPNPVPTGPEPGKPATPPSGDPEAFTPPVEPPTLVGEDPAEGDLSISKEASNETRGDGTTHVGDTVRYEIVLRNGGLGTSWMDAIVYDDIPRGLEPVSGTIAITWPDGRTAAVADAAWNPATRRLAVGAGHLYGGQTVTLAFDALVTESALNSNIGNMAAALGIPPSRWNPDGEHPEPGLPFDPPGGWDAWERNAEKVTSNTAYPPGVTAEGGVLAGTADDHTTISRKLAQTGDAVATLAGAALALALEACALALATRRRRRV